MKKMIGVVQRIGPIALLLLITTPAFPRSAGIDWERITHEAISLYEKANHDRVEGWARKALKMAKKNAGPDHPGVAEALNNLAEFYVRQGHYAQAEPLYKRLLAIQEKSLGPEHPTVSWTLAILGLVSEKEGNFVDSKHYFKRLGLQAESLLTKVLLAILEKALGPDPSFV